MSDGRFLQGNSTRKENHLLRTICALFVIFVIIVHYEPNFDVCGMEFNNFIQCIGRFAMPVFFMISGYYLYSKDQHSEKSLSRKTLRILILLVFLKVFYLIMDIVLAAMGKVDWDDVLPNFVFGGPSTVHHWFVLILFIIYAVHWIMHHFKIDFKCLLPISVILLILDMIVAELLPLFDVREVLGISINDLMTITYVCIGFAFFQFGYYLHKYKENTDKIPTLWLVLGMVFGMALHLFESYMILKFGNYDNVPDHSPNMTIGTVIFSLSLFLATFRVGENTLRCRPLEWMGRNIMPWMYVFVMAGIYPLKLFYLNDHMDDFFMYNVVGLLLSIVIDILLSLLMYYLLLKLSKRKEAKRNSQTVA